MNIKYTSAEIVRFYSQHRNTWADFYPSERWVLERVATDQGQLNRVLDVGCAAGGLGRALAERFSLAEYVGIDINEQVIQATNTLKDMFPVPCRFEWGDIANPACLPGQQFELVCAFSSADWNLDPLENIKACWTHVAPDGYLVLSLRLTPQKGVNDITRSYQYIHFGQDLPADQAEKANYVIFNIFDALTLLANLSPPPGFLLGYGYWGQPAATAVTLYQKVVFAVFALKKTVSTSSGPKAELHLPLNLLTR